MATFWTLGCDADDPQRLAAFWALALGYVKEAGFGEADNASIVDPDGRGPAIGFLKVPEGKSAKNRVHLDFRADDRNAEVERVVALGATVVDQQSVGPLQWTVLQDPEGNEFCIAND